MRIGIVTLPLCGNYGGILQNYALQQVLKRQGHEPITINRLPSLPIRVFIRSTCKTLLLFFIPGKRRRFARFYAGHAPQTREFINKYIVRTYTVRKYSPQLLKQYDLAGLVVGSDQVWRPRYNRSPEDMFLRFARHADVKKIAYAASFGVDNLEFTPRQLRKCKSLMRQFDAVSVREASGVKLCREYFNVGVEQVPDPALMLDKSDYERLCMTIPRREEKFLMCYILDPTDEQRLYINRIAFDSRLEPRYVTAGGGATLSVEEWIAMFRDAQYVVTDSFHGTVFSIIFRKPFVSIVNQSRGADRFVSLLKTFQLEHRLITSAKDLSDVFYSGIRIDWSKVDDILSADREKSCEFLRKALI